jgi:hypothetical protein
MIIFKKKINNKIIINIILYLCFFFFIYKMNLVMILKKIFLINNIFKIVKYYYNYKIIKINK